MRLLLAIVLAIALVTLLTWLWVDFTSFAHTPTGLFIRHVIGPFVIGFVTTFIVLRGLNES